MHSVPDAPIQPTGLTADEVDRLFSGLNAFSNLALGVSGGADSLCLLVLFGEWRERASWHGKAEVVVVDHGLRPESAAESEFVIDAASRSGLPATRLRWDSETPRSNVQERARQARYRLIAEHVAATGAQALLLAHHLDDQAETFLDRLTRGSGPTGLSAMTGDTLDGPEGLRLLRPFLAIRKARLEESLRERGLTWCLDPSNFDTKYKRSRLRRIMGLLEEEGLTAERLAETAGHMRRASDALDKIVRDIAARKVEHHPAGPCRVGRPSYAQLPEDLRLRLLNEIMETVTGLHARPRFTKLQALDTALVSGAPARQPLCGTIFETDGTTLWCWREEGRKLPETLSEFGQQGLWDNRYVYTLDRDHGGDGGGLRLGPLRRAPLSRKDVFWPEGWPKAAFDCSPVVWSEDGRLFATPVSLKHRLGENNHSCMLNLARVPIRGKLCAGFGDHGDPCGEI